MAVCLVCASLASLRFFFYFFGPSFPFGKCLHEKMAWHRQFFSSHRHTQTIWLPNEFFSFLFALLFLLENVYLKNMAWEAI